MAGPWLWAGGGVAVLAGVGVWRGRVKGERVSAVWLWREVGPAPAGRGRRVDPVWAAVAVAAVLAAGGLARPVWRVGGGGRGVAFPACEVRSTAAGAEAWVRNVGAVRLRVDGREVELPAAAGAGGGQAVALDGKGDEHMLELMERGRVVAGARFRRPMEAGFEILQQGAVDGALVRAFRVQPGARGEAAGRAERQVVLVNDPRFVLAAGAASGPASGEGAGGGGPALILIEGAAHVPGLTLKDSGEVAAPADARLEAVDLPAFIHVDGVRVARFVPAAVSGEWTVRIRLGEWPWMAERRVGVGGGTTVVWLASHPSSETNWVEDPSFVLTMADLVHRVLPAAENSGQAWDRTEMAAGGGAAARVIPLGVWLGWAAAGMLVAAMAMFWRRGR
ncbi:MAG TPA: hypothetical protein VHQ47_09390 [Phycisphaerae bacterium]|nr:hypothetical protein [Phycisphaerae bacterium]